MGWPANDTHLSVVAVSRVRHVRKRLRIVQLSAAAALLTVAALGMIVAASINAGASSRDQIPQLAVSETPDPILSVKPKDMPDAVATPAPAPPAEPVVPAAEPEPSATAETTSVRSAEPAIEDEAEPAGAVAAPSGDAVTDLTNAARAEAGCEPLAYSGELDAFAEGWSAQQAADGTMRHSSDPFTGIPGWGTSGENVAAGQGSAEEVAADWLASPDHRANMLDCGFTSTGVAAAPGTDGRLYWTQVFGA